MRTVIHQEFASRFIKRETTRTKQEFAKNPTKNPPAINQNCAILVNFCWVSIAFWLVPGGFLKKIRMIWLILTLLITVSKTWNDQNPPIGFWPIKTDQKSTKNQLGTHQDCAILIDFRKVPGGFLSVLVIPCFITYIIILANSANTKCRPFHVKINCSKLRIGRLQQLCHVIVWNIEKLLLFGLFLTRKIITIFWEIVLNFRQMLLKGVLLSA